jgi:hypothetical protein
VYPPHIIWSSPFLFISSALDIRRASSISLRLEETHWNRCCRERTDRFECVYTLEGLGGVERGTENPRRPSTMTGNTRDNFLSSLRNFYFPFDARAATLFVSLAWINSSALFPLCVCVCVLDSSVCISVLELGDSVFLGNESSSLSLSPLHNSLTLYSSRSISHTHTMCVSISTVVKRREKNKCEERARAKEEEGGE